MEQNVIDDRALESEREQLRAIWPGLTFANDYVFGAVLKSSPELCRRLLECVLEVPIDRVKVVETQRETRLSQDSKGIRVDAYVSDGSGRVFDVEMQRSNSMRLAKRARYYQAALDTERLHPGDDYGDLPECYIIFALLNQD